MALSVFDDRELSLRSTPEPLAELAQLLGSRTRLAILSALMASPEPLNINEIGRRVGVDASPARMHLELLLKDGLVRETSPAGGRERRFTTTLANAKLVLEGIERAAAPERGREPPKDVQRLERKLADLAKDRAKLDERARKIKGEIAEAWAKAAAKAQKA